MSSDLWVMLGMFGLSELLVVVIGTIELLFNDWKDLVKAMMICAAAFTAVVTIAMCFAKAIG